MQRKPPLIRWEDPKESEALILLAQRLEEALFDHTLDSFKAPALNSAARADELLNSSIEVEGGILRPESLSLISQELCHSLRRDDAAREVLGQLSGTLGDIRVWEKAPPRELKALAEVVRARLSQGSYEAALIRRLEKALSDSDFGAIDAYVPLLAVEWIRAGHSREHIYHKTRAFFFPRRPPRQLIRDTTAFKQFISEVRSESKEWTVVFRASECLGALSGFFQAGFVEFGSEAPGLPRTTPHCDRFLNEPLENEIFATFPGTTAPDPYQAHLIASRRLEMLVEMVGYRHHGEPIKWAPKAVVVADGAPAILLNAPKPATKKLPDPPRERLGAALEETLSSLPKQLAAGESALRLFASLQMHGSAIRSEAEETQLVGLWSALESLLPVAHVDSGVRQLKKLAVPILSRGYPTKILVALSRAFKRTSGTAGSAFLNQVPGAEGLGHLERFVWVLLDRSIRSEFEQMCSLCQGNPLLLFRLNSFSGRFSTGQGILGEMEEHERRVGWHLSRLYRARNSVVHNGRAPLNAGALIENLHAYYHTLVDAISTKYREHEGPVDIGAIVAEIGLNHSAHLEALRRAAKDSIDRDNARLLLWGED